MASVTSVFNHGVCRKATQSAPSISSAVKKRRSGKGKFRPMGSSYEFTRPW